MCNVNMYVYLSVCVCIWFRMYIDAFMHLVCIYLSMHVYLFIYLSNWFFIDLSIILILSIYLATALTTAALVTSNSNNRISSSRSNSSLDIKQCDVAMRSSRKDRPHNKYGILEVFRSTTAVHVPQKAARCSGVLVPYMYLRRLLLNNGFDFIWGFGSTKWFDYNVWSEIITCVLCIYRDFFGTVIV